MRKIFLRIIFSKYFKIAIFVLVLGILGFKLFQEIQTRPMERWDEQTNVAVVNQTLKTSNPLLLKLEGVNFLEKPPLWYYITEGIVAFTGNNYIGYRITSTLSAFLLMSMIFVLLKKYSGFWSGIFGCVVFLSVPQLFTVNVNNYFSSHTLSTADLDALQMVFIFFSFFILYYKKIESKTIYLSFLSLGLGFLTKGPLVAIPMILNILYLLSCKVKIKKLIFGMFWFAGPIFVWLSYMILNIGTSFANAFIGYHLLSRATEVLEGHKEATEFYIKLFMEHQVNPLGQISVILLLIFIVRLIYKLFKQIFVKIRKQKIEEYIYIISPFVYSNLFIFLFLVIITAVNTKLAWYILPVYPFVAVQIAMALSFAIKLAKKGNNFNL